MTAFDFTARSITGDGVDFRQFAGQVLLIVNTASRCGFTPQYEGLEQLHRTYRARGFSVLGFPCNQFGRQEPGEAKDIATFCDTRFSISFPLFDRVEVNGAQAHPLFRWLTRQHPGLLGPRILWNFTKFLIDRSGVPVSRFGPMTRPTAIAPAIERLL